MVIVTWCHVRYLILHCRCRRALWALWGLRA